MCFTIRAIRKVHLQIEDAVFWILFMCTLLIMSAFPSLVVALSAFLGIDSPANFVFLGIIFVLMLKIFSMSIQMSKIDSRIKELAQRLALENKVKDKQT